VLREKDDGKRLCATRTLEKLEEVGPSNALRKRQLENLPSAYYSPYVIHLTELDNELSQDELIIFEYVLEKLKMWMTGNISNQSFCMISDAFGKAVYRMVNNQRIYDWGSVAL